MRRALPAYIGALMLTASAPAMAQYSGMVEVDLNMRAGPSTSFPVVTTIPSDTQVTINGCINGSKCGRCDSAGASLCMPSRMPMLYIATTPCKFTNKPW